MLVRSDAECVGDVAAIHTGRGVPSLAVALSVRADASLFDTEERVRTNELRLRFEEISRFGAEEKEVVSGVLDSLILKHEAQKWAGASYNDMRVRHR